MKDCPACEGEPSQDDESTSAEEGVAPAARAAEVFTGTRLTVEVAGGERTYIELVSPAPRVDEHRQTRTADVSVVLDCSYSMRGRRMDCANKALGALYSCPEVASITVLRFGSRPCDPVIIRKGEVSNFPKFEADLGQTMFVPALQMFDAHLQRQGNGSDGKKEQLAVLISDGAASDRPMCEVHRLGDTLRRLDCPLLSISITTNVSPDVMVSLSQLHGGLPHVLVKDTDPDGTLAERLVNELPLGNAQDRLRLDFTSAATRELVDSSTYRFRRDGSSFMVMAPASVPFKSLKVAAFLVEDAGNIERVELHLEDLNSNNAHPVADETRAESNLRRLDSQGRALLQVARGIIGSFLTGAMQRQEAEDSILALRAAFHREVGGDVNERTLIMTQLGVGAAQEELTETQRAQVASVRRARRTAVMECQQEFNKFLTTVGRNDLKAALEAYSCQSVSSKFNKRVSQIAQLNQHKAAHVVSHATATRVLNSFGDEGKSMSSCLLWLCNPYEAVPDFATADQGEWVGRAVWLVPGRSAALNAWRIAEVLVRPLWITNSLIPQIRINEVDGRRTAQVGNTGYPVFNGCLPMISPGEHVGAVRLGLHMIRSSTAGQQSLSDLVCGSPDLFSFAMVNATYVVAVLSSLRKAHSQADYEGVLCALLTTIDLANYDYGGVTQWSEVLGKLVGEEALPFVSNKDMTAMPDPLRAFQAIVCSDAAYELPEDRMRLLFRRLFMRSALDQTSEQLDIFAAVGIKRKEYISQCECLLRDMSDEDIEVVLGDSSAATPPAPTFQLSFENRLHVSALSMMYGLHMALRRHLQGERISGLVERVMGGTIPVSDLVGLLREAGNSQGCVSTVFGGGAVEEVVRNLVTAACYGHHTGEEPQPKHDGKYTLACMQAVDTVGWSSAGLGAIADEVRRRALSSLYRKAATQVHYDRHKLGIVRAWASRAEAFLDEHPWEAHRHEMPQLTLGFTTDSRTFRSRAELWECLQDGWYHREDLQQLYTLTREDVHKFDFDAWKAKHRHFLPGFHIYSRKNLVCCEGVESYVASMKRDLDAHYAGRNGQMFLRTYTDKMKAWVEPYAQHIWQESRVFATVRESCASSRFKAAEGVPEASVRETIMAEVLERFPEIEQLPSEAKDARKRHIAALVLEARG